MYMVHSFSAQQVILRVMDVRGVVNQVGLNEESIMGKRRLTREEFIEKAKAVHGDKYDYSQVVYESYLYEVDIVCRIHGVFSQGPSNHIGKGQGCPECYNEKRRTSKSSVKI